MPYVVSDECIQCGVCVAGCSQGAISEGENKSVIDPSLCIECGTCADNCPSSAITFVEEEGQVVPPAPLATSGKPNALPEGHKADAGQVGQ